MSTAINSTHQQDRVAQQKLVNARQHASAQGQQQGAAFAQMLSLACDEDTDLDALQLGGKLFGLPADEPADDADTPSTTRRKGGKGVATAVGVVIGVNGLLALATVLTFAIVVFFSRYVSLASMVAAVFAPVFYLFGDGVAWQASAPEVLSLAVMALLLVWRHRENINRLLAGTESQLGKKKA